MVRLIKTQCPNCGAQLEIQDGWKFALCNYCGSKLTIDDGIIRVEHHIYDEAKLKEIDIRKKKKKNVKIKSKKKYNCGRNGRKRLLFFLSQAYSFLTLI